MSSRTDSRETAPLREFVELRERINDLPLYLRDMLLPLCDKVGHFIRLQGRLIAIAQEAVDDLQLENKYLGFDLEVTQREKDLLLEMDDEQQEE